VLSRASGVLAAVVLGFALMAVPAARAESGAGGERTGLFTCGPSVGGVCSGSCSVLICPLTPNVIGATCVCVL